ACLVVIRSLHGMDSRHLSRQADGPRRREQAQLPNRLCIGHEVSRADAAERVGFRKAFADDDVLRRSGSVLQRFIRRGVLDVCFVDPASTSGRKALKELIQVFPGDGLSGWVVRIDEYDQIVAVLTSGFEPLQIQSKSLGAVQL